MKAQKKHTTAQKLALLEKQNQQLFGLLIQLGQEVEMIGGMSQTTLQVLKEMPNYETAVEKFKAAAQKAEEDATAEASTQETSTNVNDLILD